MGSSILIVTSGGLLHPVGLAKGGVVGQAGEGEGLTTWHSLVRGGVVMWKTI